MSQIDQARFDAEPPKRGWFRRNWLWFVPTIILLPIFLCGGCVATIVYVGLGAVKDTDAYKGALQRVQNSPEVQAVLGQPIEDATVLPSSDYKFRDGEETITLRFSVKGPKGGADVESHSFMVGDAWHFDRLEVTPSDGSALIDLSDEPVVLEGDAPVFGDEAPEAEEAPAEDERPKRPPPALNIDIEE